jgi:restriction system protein
MARRKKKESGLDAVLAAPWWVSAVLAAGVYIALQWIVPAMTANNPITKMMGEAFKPLGTVIAVMFGLIAAILYFKQRPKSPLEFGGSPDTRQTAPARTSVPIGSGQPADPHAWGKSPAGNQQIANRVEHPDRHAWGNLPVGSVATSHTSSDAVADAWNDAMKKVGGGARQPKPTAWSLELLRQIEWKRVEELTAAYFREKSFRTETIKAGADGGIDVKLFIPGKADPFAVVQCKAWNTQKVGVKPVRELLGVMAHEKVAKGIFVTTGEYTKEAIAFAKENPIDLITGEMLSKGIFALADDARARLLAVATEGDYTTPTCPSCGIKMVRRSSDRGAFWGCTNYPRCKQKFFSKADAG